MQPIGQDTTAKRRPTAFGEKSQEVASLPGLEPGTYCLEVTEEHSPVWNVRKTWFRSLNSMTSSRSNSC